MIVKNDMKKVTLLIPGYNEEAMLPTLYQRLIELVNRNAVYEWEILFVNDGSSDTTLECLRRLRQQDKRVNYVNLSRNFGKEVAMLAGFDYATGDCCVVMDADLQDPPELVDQMLEYWEEGYDDIYAKRRTRGEESWLRRQFSLAFYGILQRMSRIDILPNVGDFRLLDRRCADDAGDLSVFAIGQHKITRCGSPQRVRYFCFGSVQDNSNAQGRWCTTVLPRFVIPRSEATWESREGSYDFANSFPAILLGTARSPRPVWASQ